MKLLPNLKRYLLAAILVGFMGTANANDRYSTIAGIVALWDAEMGASPGWETEFTAALNDASDTQLSDIQNASSYDAVRAILLGANVPTIPDGVVGTEALGSLTQDLVYTPVFPCRIFDTRNTPGTPVNNQVNSYVVHGGVAGQGGNPAGCTAPKGEPVGISVNLAAVPVSTVGHLRIYPFNGTLPTASFLNYFGGGNIANSGIITTCYLCGPDISVYNRNTAHSFADVMGYFYPAEEVVEHVSLPSCSAIATSPSWSSCGSITINAPGPGKIIVTTKATGITFGQDTVIEFGIGTNTTSIVDGVQVGVLDGTDTIRREWALMDQVVFTRSAAGAVTYRVNARRPSVFSARQANVFDIRMTAEYVAD